MKAMSEKGDARDGVNADVIRSAVVAERIGAEGVYTAQCIGPREEDSERYHTLRTALFALIGETEAMELLRRSKPGYGQIAHGLPISQEAWRIFVQLQDIEFEEKWNDTFPNTVTTVGANEMLDKYFAGSSYTAAIVMGLKGTGTAVIADTQASHASWSEVGLANAPVYTGNRPTPAWSAASAKSKAISAALNFAFTSGGTVAGAFLNQGGSATKDNTTGVLISAGDFTGGSKTVANTDQINVSWSITV